MSNIMRTYRVSFTLQGEIPVKVQTIKALSKKDVKSVLLASGYNVDEIISCYEI
ncbi:MAG: hypothetical protein M0P43_01680 [Arcobacteraceae bacterium]|nr:hypothetical protein [Arcobacteraceae bacterium]